MKQLLLQIGRENPISVFQREQAEKISLCKSDYHLYSIHNENGDLVTFKAAPNICGSPLCASCAEQRKIRIMLKYAPYLDDDLYPRQSLRHIIATTPTFPRERLPDMIGEINANMTKFHAKMRRSYGYAFNAIAMLELKLQETGEYYFHVHYGVISFVNIAKFRLLWSSSWRQDLVVKFPEYKGRPQYRTNKWAYLEYAARRRSEQAFRIPLEDYFGYVRHAQLIRRIGFSKQAITRILTTIRQKYRLGADLPTGWTITYLGNVRANFDLKHFGERYKDALANVTDEDLEIFSLAACRRMIARRVMEDMGIVEYEKGK